MLLREDELKEHGYLCFCDSTDGRKYGLKQNNPSVQPNLELWEQNVTEM